MIRLPPGWTIQWSMSEPSRWLRRRNRDDQVREALAGEFRQIPCEMEVAVLLRSSTG